MSNFQALEVVDRGSETQPQVLENSNKLTLQDNRNIFHNDQLCEFLYNLAHRLLAIIKKYKLGLEMYA